MARADAFALAVPVSWGFLFGGGSLLAPLVGGMLQRAGTRGRAATLLGPFCDRRPEWLLVEQRLAAVADAAKRVARSPLILAPGTASFTVVCFWLYRRPFPAAPRR
jgi:hypothetical protein